MKDLGTEIVPTTKKELAMPKPKRSSDNEQTQKEFIR